MASQYKKIPCPFPADWQPAYISTGLKQVLDAVHAITGIPIYVGQPPYNTKNRASAGTHDKRNCADLYGRKGHEQTDLATLQKWLRLLGWPGWVRNPQQGNWPWHLHFLKHGDTGLASVALDQDKAYIADRNGLGYKGMAGKDYGFRPEEPDITHLGHLPLGKFKVRSETGGYSQPLKRKTLEKKRRSPGFVIDNHVCTVESRGVTFVVTDSGTFYDRSKLVAA